MGGERVQQSGEPSAAGAIKPPVDSNQLGTGGEPPRLAQVRGAVPPRKPSGPGLDAHPSGREQHDQERGAAEHGGERPAHDGPARGPGPELVEGSVADEGRAVEPDDVWRRVIRA